MDTTTIRTENGTINAVRRDSRIIGEDGQEYEVDTESRIWRPVGLAQEIIGDALREGEDDRREIAP